MCEGGARREILYARELVVVEIENCEISASRKSFL